MTQEQRDVLRANLDGDGGEYNIVTIEYPSLYGLAESNRDMRGDDGLKIVSRLVESTRIDVDTYRPDGSVENSGFYAREG